MQMTVYLDQVWLLNGVVDYLLLSVCGTLTASLRRRWRLLLAAAMGGIYAVVCLLPGWEFLENLLWRILAGLALCLMAYGPGQGFLRRSLVLGLLTAAFSGIVLLLTAGFSAPAAMIGGNVYYPVGLPLLILTAGGSYGLMSMVLGKLTHGGGDIRQVDMTLRGKRLQFTALRDTGNTLRDPISGEKVMVGSWTLLSRALPELKLRQEDFSQPQELMERLLRNAPELRPRLIPFRSVGVSSGLLLALRADRICIDGVEEKLLLALSPTPVSDGGSYEALLGGIT
ncbi:MAG: sigma-E processing peptidase SpoIIGA [Oscillospiraceae bacterium]|nr:sigma-E processing peptidase SpoIIGA [Oscillospiraceae bacterium]